MIFTTELLQKITLQTILVEYLETNNLTLAYAARLCDIPWTSFKSWTKGERTLPDKKLDRIKKFLNGEYTVSVETVVNHLLNK